MVDYEDLEVKTPKKWMDGWDRIYKEMLEAPNDELAELEVLRPIPQLMHAIHITKQDISEMTVLEVACGDGATSCYLAKHGAEVTGVEALESALNVARRRVQLLGLEEKVELRLQNMDGWPIPHESYSIVIAIQCLQYLFERTIPRLRELLAAIRPGGFFVYRGNVLPHMETDPPIRFITEAELRKELEGWTFHTFGMDQEMIRDESDIRGHVWTVARKPVSS
jgi:cyclopropane fatty-acyl-phospholipid synthase-like methyltransferase